MRKLDADERARLVERVFPRKAFYRFLAALPVLILFALLINPPEWVLLIVGGAYSLWGYSITKEPFFSAPRTREEIDKLLDIDARDPDKSVDPPDAAGAQSLDASSKPHSPKSHRPRSPMASKPKKIIYYKVECTRSDRGDGWDLMNRDRLQSDGGRLTLKKAWPDGARVLPRGPWTLPDYLEPPHFVFDRSLGRPPHDFDVRDGIFLISAKMKSLLEELAPDACDYRPCVTSYRNGKPGPELWVGSVVRAFKDAVDLDNSNIKVSAYGQYLLPYYPKKAELAFKPEVIGSANVFRLAETPFYPFCDEHFRARCREAGIKGIAFSKVGSITVASN